MPITFYGYAYARNDEFALLMEKQQALIWKEFNQQKATGRLPLEAPEEAKLQSKFLHNAFWMVFTVPAAALSAASASTKTDAALALSIVIWITAGAVGIAAVVCAAVLMIYSRGRKVEDGDGLRKMPKM